VRETRIVERAFGVIRATLPLLVTCLAAQGCASKTHHVATRANITSHAPPQLGEGPVVGMTVPHGANCGPSVAVIDVDGLLINADFTGMSSFGENPVSLFRERLDTAAADPCVRAIVVRINSPGGGVTATDIMWHDLRSFKARTRLPVVACLMDLGAGGAYYLATAADSVVAHPTTVTGGIGVILNVYNLEDAMAQFNMQGTPVKAGDNIDLATPIKPLAPEQRELLQTMCDEFHARFRQVVREGRPDVDPNEPSTFDGRVFTARQALERSLIDEIGYLDDAVALAREMSGVPQARVVLYHRTNDRARSEYAITPNSPLQGGVIPMSMPGLDRARLPGFLYLWQPDPTLEKQVGH
jgi:protease IV